MNEADMGDTRMQWVVVTAVLVQVLIVTIWVGLAYLAANREDRR